MSQSPETPGDGQTQDTYLAAFGELARRIREGASFSGRERHCAFLNTGEGSYADVSAVSGFGLPMDGRGMALTDWDHDGDLDLWLSNRTAPRTQFLQNTIPPQDASWVALRLQGNPALKCPRDAIGSRVEVVLAGTSERRVKTLHAGNGLMSQSTKWLHFGLGKENAIEKVVVQWAGGSPEEFTGVQPGQRWNLRQGQGQGAKSAQPVAHRAKTTIGTKPLALPPPTEQARIRLSQPLKIPELSYRDFSGTTRRVNELTGRHAVLVNLWATWCAPCGEELKAFAEAQEELDKHGIVVVALNVDHLGTKEISPQSASTALQKLAPGMRGGMAGPELVAILEQSILKTVYHHRGLPVPVSFLIDRGGWLSAIYKGPVEVDQVITDRRNLGKDAETARAAALPFAGRWAETHFLNNPMTIAAAYLEGQYLDDARAVLNDFLAKNEAPPGDPSDPVARRRNIQLGGIYFQLAEISLLEKNQRDARAFYETSLTYNPRQIPALNNLAWLLATSSDPEVRDGAKALEHAQFMMRAPRVAENPTLLATLAACQAGAGRFAEAISTTQRILSILGDEGPKEQIQLHRDRLRQFEEKRALEWSR